MEEYIFYVILIFVPIGGAMAYLLHKDGLQGEIHKHYINSFSAYYSIFSYQYGKNGRISLPDDICTINSSCILVHIKVQGWRFGIVYF